MFWVETGSPSKATTTSPRRRPAFQAWLLRLDPAVYVHVESLSKTVRLAMRANWVTALVCVLAALIPIAVGLTYAVVWLLQRVNQILRVRLLERFQALSLRFHAESRVGDAIYRLYQDSAMVTAVINTLFFQPIRFAVIFLFAFAVVTVLDPLFGALLISVWAPTLWLGFRFSSPMRVGFVNPQ